MFAARAVTSTHALTFCYNNVYGATTSWCYKITEFGECFRLPTSGVPVDPGTNRLPIIRNIPLEQVHTDLEALHYYTDSRLYGPRFHKKPEHLRSSYIGIVEHVDTNIHVHLLWTMPREQAEELADHALIGWKKITDGYGSVAVARLHDAQGWASYCCKDLGRIRLDEEPLLFVSSKPARPAKPVP